jgi:apolipoprotein N-acyltransferase
MLFNPVFHSTSGWEGGVMWTWIFWFHKITEFSWLSYSLHQEDHVPCSLLVVLRIMLVWKFYDI